MMEETAMIYSLIYKFQTCKQDSEKYQGFVITPALKLSLVMIPCCSL